MAEKFKQSEFSPERELQNQTVVDGLDDLRRTLADRVAADIKKGREAQRGWKKDVSPLILDIKIKAENERQKGLRDNFNIWSEEVEKVKRRFKMGEGGRPDLKALFAATDNWRNYLYYKNVNNLVTEAKYLIDILPEDPTEDTPSTEVDPRGPTKFLSSENDDSWEVNDVKAAPRVTLPPGAIGRGKLRGAGRMKGASAAESGAQDTATPPNPAPETSASEVTEEKAAAEPPPAETGRPDAESSAREKEKIREERRELFERTMGRLDFMREKIADLKKTAGRDLSRSDLPEALSERQMVLEENLVQLDRAVADAGKILLAARRDQDWDRAVREIDRVEKKFGEMKNVKQAVESWTAEVRQQTAAKKEAEEREKKDKAAAAERAREEEFNRELASLTAQVEEVRDIDQDEIELKKKLRRDFLDHHLKDYLPADHFVRVEQFYNDHEVWTKARIARDLGKEVLADFKKNKKHSSPERTAAFTAALTDARDAWTKRQADWQSLLAEIGVAKSQAEADYREKLSGWEKISTAVQTDCERFSTAAEALGATEFQNKIARVSAQLVKMKEALLKNKNPVDHPDRVKLINDSHRDLLAWRTEQELWERDLAAAYRDTFTAGAERIAAAGVELSDALDDFYWRDDERSENRKFLADVDGLADYFRDLADRAATEPNLLALDEIAQQKNFLVEAEKIIADRWQELRAQKEQAEAYEAATTAKKIRAKIKKPKVATPENRSAASAEPEKPVRPLVKKSRVEKTIDKFLTAEKVVDIPPTELTRSLSEKEMEVLQTAMQAEDELTFARVIRAKIDLFAPRLSADASKRLTDETYDTVKRLVAHEITAETAVRGGQKMIKLKIGGRVILNLGWTLGVGAGVGLTLGTGVLAAATAGAAVVAGRLLSRGFLTSEAGQGLSGKLKKWWAGDKKPDTAEELRLEAAIRENAVDNVCTKENLATMLSNFLREETTQGWTADRDKLSAALADKASPIPEAEYASCLEVLRGSAQKEFFTNSLNYVNVAPEYAKVLQPQEKIVLAQLVTLTVGAGLRTDLEARQAFGAMKQRTQSGRQSSWLADKLAWLSPGKKLSEKMSEKVAGHVWAGVLGAAVSRAVKEISPTWRAVSGAVSGAAAGLAVEQMARRGGAKKYETETAVIAAETNRAVMDMEKILTKYEDRPIEKISMGQLNKIAGRVNELQARADSGLLDEMDKTDGKILRSRLDGLVYRARKMESAKAMELEKAGDILIDLANLAEKNNRDIIKKEDKLISRLKKATRDRTAVYALGGAAIGALAGYFSGDDAEKPAWLAVPVAAETDDFDEVPEIPDIVAPVSEPSGFVGAEHYAPDDGPNPLMPKKSARPLIIESSATDKIAEVPSSAQDPSPAVDAGSAENVGQAITEASREIKEELGVWLAMLKDAPQDFRNNLHWLNETLRSTAVSDEIKVQLREFKDNLYQGFQETGAIDAAAENKYFEAFKKAVKEELEKN